MDERRKAERVKTLLKAKIVFNNRMTSVDCVVKNISPFGAKIAVGDALSIPDEFELDIPLRGKRYRAQMQWRDAEGMGVEFVEDRRDVGERDVEKLHAENIRLRNAVIELTKRLEDLGQDVPKFL